MLNCIKLEIMKNSVKILTLVFLLSSVSCASVKVVTDLNPEVDFSKYDTYSFLGWQDDSHELMSEFDQKRVHDAFRAEFDARGLRHVESGGDMEISLFLVLDQKTVTTAYTDHYGSRNYGYHRYGLWGVGHSTTSYHESDYTVGTLIMDVFDSETREQVWQAIGKGTMEVHPAKRETSTPRAINKLMKDFPVEVIE